MRRSGVGIDGHTTGPVPVIVGHSHVIALGVRLHDTVRQCVLRRDSRFDCLEGPSPRDDAYWDTAVALAASRPLAISWNGNQHYVSFIFAPTPRLDFSLAARPDLQINTAATIVPELAVRAWVASSLVELEELLTRIAAAKGPASVLLGTPPPKGNNEALRRLMSCERALAMVAERIGVDPSTAELSSPVLLLKLWLLLQDMMRAIADKYGLSFCPSPGDAATADGFLLEELWQDATHANHDYGALVLRDLASRLCVGTIEPSLQP